jgi:NhaP-type Na+/H+ or K+/H+ antiporter
MIQLHLLYAVIGVAGLVLALLSRQIRQWPLSEPLVVMLLGVLAGPEVTGVLDLSAQQRDLVLLEGSRLLLAWSVMAAALRYPVRSVRLLTPPVLLLLVVVMPMTAAAAAGAAMLLGVPLVLALVIGACLCPTDPVLAASVITGQPAERAIPGRVRQLLTCESGANDGLALPVVILALAAALPGHTVAAAVGELTWQVGAGTGIGVVIGAATGLAVRAALRHQDMERGPELVLTLLLAVATLGVCRLSDTDGILGAFVAGLAYNALVSRSEQQPQESVDEAVNRYAALPLFFIFGAVLPWSDWISFGPAAVAFTVLMLVGRRLPFVLLLSRPLRLPLRDAVFAGWFGPIGVSAIFYLAHSAHEGISDPRLFAAGSLAVAASIIAFGISASPARKLYQRTR